MSKKAILTLEDGEIVKQYLKEHENSYECLASIRKLTQSTYARFTDRHIYYYWKNHLNPRLCHDPLTHDEINFIVEQAQKQQRSKVIDWKFIIRDLEKKFGKLHSINKVRDFWHSWNFDLTLYHDQECHDPLGDDEKKFIIRRVPKYQNSYMIWESVIRDLKNKFGKLRSADKIKMVWYSKQNRILDMDLCPDFLGDEKIFIIQKHRTSNGTIWKYVLRDLENKFSKFHSRNNTYCLQNREFKQHYTPEEKCCNNYDAIEPTKCEKYNADYYVLLKTIRNWRFPNDNYSRLEKSFDEPEILKEFIDADNIMFKKSFPEILKHSEAIYSGRSMCFHNLPVPRNSVEDPE
ncbi:3613_t:CDS:2, partial [Rhizophagus irregularis]